jgi:crotonobetainyl-CoA:carnitine CoA-transferase CaiB-like acyl-CoA transferase
MDSILHDIFRGRTSAEWVEALNAAGIAAGPIYKLDQVFTDPQVRLAGLIQDVTNAEWGPHKVLRVPVNLSRTPAAVEHGAPMTGEHTRETLEGLGYDDGAIEKLLAEGVVEQTGGGES